MPRLLAIILGAVAVIAAYFGIRSLMPDGRDVPEVAADRIPTLDKALPTGQQGRDGMQVVFIRSMSEQRTLYFRVGGRSEAETMDVKAGSPGTVTSAPVAEGTIVEKGAMLCGLDVEGAGAKLREAEAAMSGKKEAYEYAQKRLADGWVSEAFVKSAKAAMDGAQATLDVARAELRKMQLVAPFKGTFEKRNAKVGTFLGVGGSCGIVVQLDPISFVADVGEDNVAKVKEGGPARVRMPDGTEMPAMVTYLARVADPKTRMFRVKVSASNPGNAIPVGRTAEIRIETGVGDAHRVDPALLAPDSEGRIGVRYLDVGGVVSFAPADIIDETAEGTWVTGLPREALLVAKGQDNVKPGLRVTPKVVESTATPASGGG